jgi:hypothetical protein
MVISVILIDGKGEITLSSDKKLEGKKYKNIISDAMVNTQIVMIQKEGEVFQVATPVYSFSKKIGTVVVQYIDMQNQKIGPLEIG